MEVGCRKGVEEGGTLGAFGGSNPLPRRRVEKRITGKLILLGKSVIGLELWSM